MGRRGPRFSYAGSEFRGLLVGTGPEPECLRQAARRGDRTTHTHTISPRGKP